MTFASSLPGAFAWPFRHRSRLAVWLSISLVVALARWLPWTGRRGRGTGAAAILLGLAVAAGVAYLFAVLRRSTHAPEESLPETFKNEVDTDHALENLVEFLGACFVAYLPFLAFAGYAALFRRHYFRYEEFRAALFVLGAAGTLYLPMALLLLGFSGDWKAGFNLALGVRSAVRLGTDYALSASLFGLALIVGALVETLWVARTVPHGAEAFAARATASLAQFGLMIVAARGLGLLYLARERDLGWMAKRET